jgi:hypothetical protein
MFSTCSSHIGYRPAMPDTHLRPATPDEIADALSFALRYQGRKRVNHADDMMARITAKRTPAPRAVTERSFVRGAVEVDYEIEVELSLDFGWSRPASRNGSRSLISAPKAVATKSP